jgi:hypothetical protein
MNVREMHEYQTQELISFIVSIKIAFKSVHEYGAVICPARPSRDNGTLLHKMKCY